jgi:hypothetical protein
MPHITDFHHPDEASNEAAFEHLCAVYFAGMEPITSHISSGGDPVTAWEKTVNVYRSEAGEWLGTVVARVNRHTDPQRQYTIPTGPRKGEVVYKYWAGDFRSAHVTVSLSERHPMSPRHAGRPYETPKPCFICSAGTPGPTRMCGPCAETWYTTPLYRHPTP